MRGLMLLANRRKANRRTGSLAVAIGLSLLVSACGVSPSSSTASSMIPVSADAQLAAQVPQKYKDKGTLIVGTNATFAPIEFMGDDGKTIDGLDADLMQAVAQRLGLKAQMQQADFSTIILGVSSGKFDLGASGFTITAERLKQVNMVQYLSAGLRWAVAKGNPRNVSTDNPCGHTISVQKETVSYDQMVAASQNCTDAGEKAIELVVEDNQAKAAIDLATGKSDAMLADSPVTDYAILQTGGELEPLGGVIDAAPYGIVVAKPDIEMANVMSKALQSLEADGTYAKILDKWGNSSGAVSEFPVNPDVG